MASATWHNWAGTEQARPVRVADPASTEDVVPRGPGGGPRRADGAAVGAGHSFTGAAVTSGVMIRPTGSTSCTPSTARPVWSRSTPASRCTG